MRVCVDVVDLERALAFYRDGLGLTPGRRLGANWVEMLGASAPIDLLAEPAGTSPVPGLDAVRDYRRHWTPVHIDVVVSDIESAVRRAQAAGARLEREIQTRRWGRMANLADPFGNGLCLLQFVGRGYDELLGPERVLPE